MEFDKRLRSRAAETPAIFQTNWEILAIDPTPLRLFAILW